MHYTEDFTLTDRQWEFGQRTGSKSLMPVIVPMYLQKDCGLCISKGKAWAKSTIPYQRIALSSWLPLHQIAAANSFLLNPKFKRI